MKLTRTHAFGLLVLVAVFLAGALISRLARPGHFTDFDCSTAPSLSFTSATTHFIETVQARTDRVVGGHPIEGYVPSMLMQAYPGMRPKDFVCVQAAGGWYLPKRDGTLEFISTRQGYARTSADGAITPYGMAVLLQNLQRAQALPIATVQDIGALLQVLAPAAVPSGEPERATLEGEYVCLPHRDTTGPHTMECAFGLKTADGSYYALDLNLSSALLPPLQTGDRIRASGIVTPIERLSSDHWRKYAVKGIFSVTGSLETR